MRPCTRSLIRRFARVWRAGAPRISLRDGIFCPPRRHRRAGTPEVDGGHIPTAEPCQAQGGSPRALSVEFPDNPGGDALRRAKAAGRLALTLGLTSRLGAGKEGAVTVAPGEGGAPRLESLVGGLMGHLFSVIAIFCLPEPCPRGACLGNGPRKGVTLLDGGEARSRAPSSARARCQGDVQNTLGDGERCRVRVPASVGAAGGPGKAPRKKLIQRWLDSDARRERFHGHGGQAGVRNGPRRPCRRPRGIKRDPMFGSAGSQCS